MRSNERRPRRWRMRFCALSELRAHETFPRKSADEAQRKAQAGVDRASAAREFMRGGEKKRSRISCREDHRHRHPEARRGELPSLVCTEWQDL
ncbi:hypothetical protein Mp_5g19500 [Marchantia polymorpha subsp. ruderalis]|uniref:Uncharacterized protein n=2 Tax=Marchantia polymorpha TaxID=3197 RepID=A0AAF6BK36_MARPO|nr:hypothetical protein MARPO_0134s0008 [Marchantia polymorpha]BBN12370.1 hypothetical protein Mp_5g19500 [Marchantia polymorpha subsp. ruderalis]|eukprot:PTQ29793.1 hypothetical protein MARPO_0134s0008 [Marchantia polymorpha]